MPGKLAGARIAIVEDDALLLESLALFLRVNGCHVDTFGSAEEAMESFRDKWPDIVISDNLLPGENGLSLLRRIREASRSSGTVLITGQARMEVRMEVQEAGIDCFLQKPFSTKELESALLRIIDCGMISSTGPSC